MRDSKLLLPSYRLKYVPEFIDQSLRPEILGIDFFYLFPCYIPALSAFNNPLIDVWEEYDWSGKLLKMPEIPGGKVHPILWHHQACLMTGQHFGSSAYVAEGEGDSEYRSIPNVAFGDSGTLFRLPRSIILVDSLRSSLPSESISFIPADFAEYLAEEGIYIGSMLDVGLPFLAGIPPSGGLGPFSFTTYDNQPSINPDITIRSFTKAVSPERFVGGEVLFIQFIALQSFYAHVSGIVNETWPAYDSSSVAFYDLFAAGGTDNFRFATEIIELDRAANELASERFQKVKWLCIVNEKHVSGSSPSYPEAGVEFLQARAPSRFEIRITESDGGSAAVSDYFGSRTFQSDVIEFFEL